MATRILQKILILLLVFCLKTTLSTAQKVVFEGLKRTKPSYLLKFMSWENRIPTDSLSIKAGLQSIRNTRFFNEVESRVEVNGTDTTIFFKCQEIHTALPIFELGATEGNKWIRLGLEDENGLGRGIRTIAFYQYSDRHSYYLKQSFPLIFNKWGVSYLLKKWSILEPIAIENRREVLNYTNWDGELLTNYAFDVNRHNLELGIGYTHETYAQQNDETMLMMPQKESVFKRFLLKGTHFLNFLNYNTFYVNGWSNKFFFQASYLTNERRPFHFFSNETTFFKTLPKKGNLALRGRIGISTNDNVFLAPFVLNNYYNIRGVGNRIDRGTASVTLNAEYRQTVWENRLFGIQVVGFADAGTWRKPDEQFSNMLMSDNMRLFAGVGGRFIYKKAYDFDIRFDYGMGIHGEGRGFVFGLGQFF